VRASALRVAFTVGKVDMNFRGNEHTPTTTPRPADTVEKKPFVLETLCDKLVIDRLAKENMWLFTALIAVACTTAAVVYLWTRGSSIGYLSAQLGLLVALCSSGKLMFATRRPAEYVQLSAPVSDWCETCGAGRSWDTRHCDACNTCVYGRVHHCGGLNTCIGFSNWRSFVGMFICWMMWGIILLAAVSPDICLLYQGFQQGQHCDSSCAVLLLCTVASCTVAAGSIAIGGGAAIGFTAVFNVDALFRMILH